MPTQEISRSIFDARKQYSRVHMQQGRVIVDDDWNENAAIVAEDERRTRIDVIGPAGSPDNGFKIEALTTPIAANEPVDFTIRAGTFYLGGLRLELETDETLLMQDDWLRVAASLPTRPTAPRLDLVYLEAYEQPVSAVEDDELIETALGGVDTSVRMRVVHRVAVEPGVATTDCAQAWQTARNRWAAAGRGAIDDDHELVSDAQLQVSFVPGSAPPDLCSPGIGGGYLGAENQTIRVELRSANQLTWGFDNASPLYRVALSNAGATITMLTLPRDELHWPVTGDVVEIIPWGSLLPNGEKVAELFGHLAKVTTAYDPDLHTITIAPAAANVATTAVQPAVPGAETWGYGEEWKTRDDRPTLELGVVYAYMRVWPRGGATSANAEVPYTLGTPTTLGNTGIAVTITGTSLRRGDHWIIAARPETDPDKNVLPWALQDAFGIPAHGVRRFRAPLAIIRWTPAGTTLTATVEHDCRLPFRPLTRQQSCCKFRVGDDLHSFGDFTRIQDAVNALPPEGGEICVLPGQYDETVLIAKDNVEIHGCGAESSVIAPAGATAAVFTVNDARNVTIRSLGIVATTTPGVLVEPSAAPPPGRATARVNLEELDILARDASAILVRNTQYIRVMHNQIGITQLVADLSDTSTAGKWAAITIGADDVLVEGNTILVAGTTAPRTAFGGIQVLGLSDRVELRRNYIRGGNGNGITLGSTVLVPAGTTVPTGGTDAPGGTIIVDGSGCVHVGIIDVVDGTTQYVPRSEGSLSEIRIVDNHIEGAGANGIGVVQFFDLDSANAHFITVDRLFIEGNRIRGCLRLEPLEPPAELWADVGHGGIALADGEHVVIRDNLIERNGRNHLDPVCGIFVLRAEGLTIERNHVLENGLFRGTGTTRLGHRGGIVVVQVWPGSRLLETDPGATATITSSPLSSARVHDNVVVHDIGRALYLAGIGGMSVQGNQLTSRGTNFPNLFTLVIELLQLVQDDLTDPTNRATAVLLLQELLAGRTVTVLNGGLSVELFDILAFIADATSNTSLGGYLALAAIALGGEMGDQKANLTDFVIAGGGVLFTDNQVRLDLTRPDRLLALNSTALLSLDRVNCQDNQFEIVSPRYDFVFTDVAVAAWSVSVQNNRMQENLFRSLASGVTLGFLNNTSGNQSTHCFYAQGIQSLLVRHSNRSLVEAITDQWCAWVGDAREDVFSVTRDPAPPPPPPP